MPSEIKPLPEPLGGPISRLRARCMALACIRGSGLAATAVIAAAILIGWTDLIVTLSSTVRLGLALVSLAAALVLVIAVAIEGIRGATVRNLASVLDNAGATGGQIRAGVELAEVGSVGSFGVVTEKLSERAVNQASDLATQQSLSSAKPASPALKPYLAFFTILTFLGIAWMLWPDTISAQALRVIDPTGDHAKASPYNFTIKPSAEAILYGDPFEVAVTVKGAEPKESFEWLVEQPGMKPWRLPLIASADGALIGNISTVTSHFDFTIVGPRGQSRKQHIKMISVPQIKETGVRLVFPAYTGLPPFEGPLPQGGASGVRGTQVTLFIASNRPLSSGKIEIKAEAPVKPATADGTDAKAEPTDKPATVSTAKPESESASRIVEMSPRDQKTENVVAGTFEITGDLSFTAIIKDTDGTPSAPLLGKCMMVPDQAPQITIVEPLVKSFATADVSLPVVIEAEDDFGISELILFRSLNGSRDVPMTLPLDKNNKRAMRVQTTLPLKDYGLDAGDVLEVSALARDNDPAGAKSIQSPVHRITIITKEQYAELMRQQETIEDLKERYSPWLKELADLRKKWQDAKESKDEKKIEEAKQALRDAIERLENQLKEPPVFSADQKFSEELRKLQESLKQAVNDIEKGDYDAVDNRLGNEQENLNEQLKIPLETLVKMYQLIEDEQTYVALSQVQEDIAQRLKRFADKKEVTDPQDKQDLKSLLDEQKQVREAMQRLQQDIRDHAGQLPKDDEKMKKLIDSANEFATKCHELGIEESLEKADKAMAGNKGQEAAEAAKEAAEKMMSLVQKGEGMAGEAMDGVKPFGPSISDTVQQLLNGRNMGGGGGQRSGQGRVGLYGSNKRPSKSRGGGNSDKKSDGSLPGNSGQKMDNPAGFGIRNQFDDGSSTGGAMGALPAKYRSAVRDFYRRVNDELERKR